MPLELSTTPDVTGKSSGSFKAAGNPATGALYVESLAGGGAGSSDTTEATQLLVKTAVESINTKTGEVQAAPTANTVLGRLKDLLTGIILAAGSNIIGKVGIDQTTPGTTNGVEITKHTVPSEAHTTALAASLVVKASAGTFLSVTGYNNSSSVQYIQVHNTASLPADASVPTIIFSAQPNDNFCYFLDDSGQSFSTGIVVCNSSTAATKTIGSADCWFNARYR